MKAFLTTLAIVLLTFSAFAETPKPVTLGEGKIWVQSDPVGASIFLVQDGEARPTSKVTPALINPPLGLVTILLRKEGYKDVTLDLTATDTIQKPEKVIFKKKTYVIDVIFAEDGWSVYVDSKPVMDKAGKPAQTPCTIEVEVGVHEIALSKEGFWDVKQRESIINDGAIEMKGKPTKGTSTLLKNKQEAKPVVEEPKTAIGTYLCTSRAWNGEKRKIKIHEDGTFWILSNPNECGKWESIGKNLTLKWERWPAVRLATDEKGIYKEVGGKDAMTMTKE